MELVDRYLYAVKFWLPRNQKDDIIAELSEDLRSQIEERETELGHKLTDSEVESILKRCGSPMAVAGRYLPQQSLIGPTLFPIYRVVIRGLLLYFLLPWLLLWTALALFSPDFRAAHPGPALFGSLEPWWLATVWSLFINTLVFALLDRSQMRSHMVNDWSPRALPAERDHSRIPRGNTIFELTSAVAGLALFLEFGAFRRVFHFFDVSITLSSRWPYFFWAWVALCLAGIGLSCLNLENPRWTRLSASLRLGINAYSWGMIYLVMHSSPLQSLSKSDLSIAEAGQYVKVINFWMARSAVWALLLGAIVLAFDVRRVLRVRA